MSLPRTFQKRVRDTWGEGGRRWLASLPGIIEQCKERWNLFLLESPFELSYNYITPVILEDGMEAVLKIGFARKELFTEMDALEAFHGQASVTLLEEDRERGAVLLERISPGTKLTDIQKRDDEEATRNALPLIRALAIPVPQHVAFPTVASWAKILHGTEKSRVIPVDIRERASQLLEELEQSKDEDKLLHGDLHHENILLDEKRGWLAIDPKGVIGDPVFNAARFLRNPVQALSKVDDLLSLMRKRVALLSTSLGYEPYRIASWGYVDCVMGVCWYAESGGEGLEQAINCAKVLERILIDSNS